MYRVDAQCRCQRPINIRGSGDKARRNDITSTRMQQTKARRHKRQTKARREDFGRFRVDDQCKLGARNGKCHCGKVRFN